MALQALQQLTGINFIFYYGTKYFQNSGVDSGFTISMITSAINVASTIRKLPPFFFRICGSGQTANSLP
jgi:hypothetical protein